MGVESWNDVIDKVKTRLRRWNAKSISIGGRITLIKSVLAAIPIYRLSFNPMPVTVAKTIRSLQSRFLWGGDETTRKMAWIKWDHLCKPKKDGGLGFKNLIWFANVLLFKWIWRFLAEKDHLWCRVLKSRHGELIRDSEGVRVESRGGGSSGWWRKIISLAGGDSGRWMWSNLYLQLGDGGGSIFWYNLWCGEEALKCRFPRLFCLSLNKEDLVSKMGKWVDGCWKWEFHWRRELLDREKSWVEELESVLQNVTLKKGVGRLEMGQECGQNLLGKRGIPGDFEAEHFVSSFGADGIWLQ